MALRIDLHAHSSVSDGTESPAELVRQAKLSSLDVVAITDHDSTAGWDEAIFSAKQQDIGLIPGLELSTSHNGFSVHIVSYLMDPENPQLQEMLTKMRESRLGRAQEIVRNLSADFDISWDQVLAHVAGGAAVGRPHIADTLVQLGYAATRSQAFSDILHPSKGYVVPLYSANPEEGINLIRAAGGVPVLAHPAANRHGRIISSTALASLVAAGLFGIELDHPENFESGKDILRPLAKKFGLEITGSSDWHGTGKVNQLGDGLTDKKVLEKILEQGVGAAAFLPKRLGL